MTREREKECKAEMVAETPVLVWVAYVVFHVTFPQRAQVPPLLFGVWQACREMTVPLRLIAALLVGLGGCIGPEGGLEGKASQPGSPYLRASQRATLYGMVHGLRGEDVVVIRVADADMDGDGDVDLYDFRIMQLVFGGPGE
jgi:hypothetical protein